MKNDCRTVQKAAAAREGDRLGVPIRATDATPDSEGNSVLTQTTMEGAIKNILVPTDFSPCSLQALTKAVALAHQCGAEITLLYVMDLNLHTPPTGPANEEKLKEEIEKEGREQLAELARQLTDEQIELHPLIQEGNRPV